MFTSEPRSRVAAPASNPRPLLGSKRSSWSREVRSNAVLAPIFLATSDPIPGFRWARITSHLLERLDREHGAHLAVTRLVPPDVRNGPELPKELGVITVDGERLTVEPFDLAVAPGNDGKSFGVGLDSEAIWLGKRAGLLNRALP